jgi:hypothetical protein
MDQFFGRKSHRPQVIGELVKFSWLIWLVGANQTIMKHLKTASKNHHEK